MRFTPFLSNFFKSRDFWCNGYLCTFVRLFIASEHSSFVRIVDWANDAFSLMKSRRSHFCLTKFYQPSSGTMFKLRTFCYLAKNINEVLSQN